MSEPANGAINGTSTDPNLPEILNPEAVPLPTIEQPSSSDELLPKTDLDLRLRTTNGPFITIDVQPDFRNLLSTINYHSVKICDQLSERDIPNLSPASLTGYCLNIIYTFGALCDARIVRFNTSRHGDYFITDPAREQYLTMSLWFTVPQFLREILSNMYPTFDARRPNVAFIMSFASYSFAHDLGRAFPVPMFFKLHDIMAKSEHSSNIEDILTEWYNHSVIGGAHILRVGNLLGAFIEGGVYTSYLQKNCNKLANYLFVNSSSRRPHLQPMPAKTYTVSQEQYAADVNPYLYLMGTDPYNIQLTQRHMQQLSKTLSEVSDKPVLIGDLFQLQSGIGLMNHYYIGPQLPTWHNMTLKKGFTRYTSKQYAEKIRFYSNWNLPEQPIIATPKPYNKGFMMITTDKTPITPVDELIQFNKEYELPDVLYYTPWSVSDSSLAHTALSGICIESSGIDGTSVPQPNVEHSIYLENSYILDSAIPLRSIPQAIYTDGTTAKYHLKRATTNRDTTNVCVNLYDSSTNRLPRFATHIQDAQVPAQLPHFTYKQNIATHRLSSNKWSFTIPNDSTREKAFPEMKTIHLWSSYRWINPAAPFTIPACNTVYMLSNFRTIYGTNVPIKRSKHPALIIPRA